MNQIQRRIENCIRPTRQVMQRNIVFGVKAGKSVSRLHAVVTRGTEVTANQSIFIEMVH